MAQLIKVDGSVQTLSPVNGRTFTLEEMQTADGGYVQALRLPSGQWLLMDEEGKLKGKAKNGRATLMGRACGTMPGDDVVGDVLVCEPQEFD